MPALFSVRARRSARRRVRAKTSVRVGIVMAEVLDQQVHLLLVVHGQDALLDLVDRLALPPSSMNTGLCRVSSMMLRHALAHGGAEEQVLALARHGVDDALHVGPEAHVEHAVGLVEDERVDAVQQDVALAEHVEQAAGVATSRSTPRRTFFACGS